MKSKLCDCGCGQPAPIATITRKDRGYVKGEPLRFRRGHHRPYKLIIHGHCAGRPTKEYIAYKNIGQRCRNPKNPAFKNYGGRGVTLELTFVNRRPLKRRRSVRKVDNL